MSLRIMDPGPLTLIQDAGRPGHAGWGLSPSGALDSVSARAANALLGNPAGSAVLEILLGGFSAEFLVGTRFAVTGAEGVLTLDGDPVALAEPVTASAGSVLRIELATRGLRYYLAVAGGIMAEEIAGSLSWDTLAGMGPAPLAPGEQVSWGESWAGEAGKPSQRAAVVRRAPDPEAVLAVRVLPGPRLDWFVPGTWRELTTRRWEVTAQSNRIGLRLAGAPLRRARDEQLPSEGMVTGAIQIPDGGLPVVFLADHPVTGGYPVAGVVLSADLSVLAQARPGQKIRFVPVEG